MKKLALATIAVAAFGFGHAPVSAQTDEAEAEWCEAEGLDEAECADFYVDVQPQPPVDPEEEENEEVEALTPAGQLPRTGGGVSPLLGIGGLFFVGGGIAVVASRRRSTAAPSAV